MRCIASMGVALLTASLATGCTSVSRSTPPPGSLAAGGSAAVLPAQSSGISSVPVVGSVAAAGSAVVGSITGFFKGGSATLTASARTSTVSQSDPTSLSPNTGTVSPELRVTVAQMRERSGDLAGARQQYEEALKQKPRHLEALLGLAHLLDRQGKFSEATEKYRLACKYYPKESRAFNDLGLCLARQKKFNESLKMLGKAIQLDPQKKLYRNNIATVLAEAGRMDEALSQLTAVHGPAVAHYNLGCLLYQKGNQPAAAAQFAAATQLDPSFTAARQWSEQLAAYRPAAPTSRPALTPPAVVTSDTTPPSVIDNKSSSTGWGNWQYDRVNPVRTMVASNGGTTPPTVTLPTQAVAPPSYSPAASPHYGEQRVAEVPRPLPPLEDDSSPTVRY